MGQTWDGGDIAFRPDTWAAVRRVMKPGAYLLAFGGSRTFHRLAVALEDAGFVLVDTLMWLYAEGFPKSHNVAAAVDKRMGGSNRREGPPRKNTYDGSQQSAARHTMQTRTGEWGLHRSPHGLPTVALETEEGRRWTGYGTALKPAYEPVLLCRNPGEATYADNALRWGCGALNIDGSRIPAAEEGGRPARRSAPDPEKNGVVYAGRRTSGSGFDGGSVAAGVTTEGRWPANVILDEDAARLLDAQAGMRPSGAMRAGTVSGIGGVHVYGTAKGRPSARDIPASNGGASRFFYVPKVGNKERDAGVSGEFDNDHPTLKPVALARYLAGLLLPPPRTDGDTRKLLVPFSGAGSEMIGALLAGWDEVVGIEQSAQYGEIAQQRIRWWVQPDLWQDG
jgi:site-specific DNA-methyltransferase (adenine-specific)